MKSECTAMLKFVDAVIGTAVIFLIYVNLILKSYQDIQLKLLQLYIKFRPDHLRSVRENETNRFCFLLTL